MASLGCRCPGARRMFTLSGGPLLCRTPVQHDPVYRIAASGVQAVAGPMSLARRSLASRPARPSRPLAVRAAAAAADPSASKDRFTVTTPLYYVNAAPHMGSAYPTIAADVLARYHRLAGREVRFVTGTDEHGEKIALAAEARGMKPQEHCDDIVRLYKSLWASLDIQYDSFIRTTDSKHEALVAEVLAKVWDRGDIYKAKYEGYYCVDCEEYKDEKEMDEGKNCPIHRKPCKYRSEENYFFKLSAYQQQLEDFLTSRPDFVQPAARRNEVLGWVKEGVRDFSISRSNVSWGIPVPQDPAQTVYVWFDALNGYLSGLVPEGAGLAAVSDKGWPASVHIIGKDILRFHAVYWPAMLMAARLPLPDMVYGHGFLTKDGLKMGKSLGNVLEPVSLVSAYGPDAVRLYFMAQIPFGSDGDFSEVRFRDEVNARLANDLGNLLNRTLNLLNKNCDGVAPVDSSSSIPEDHPLRAVAARVPSEVAAAYESLRIEQAIALAFELSGKGNVEMNLAEPWNKLKKGTEEEAEAAKAFLVATAEAVRIVATMIKPVTPGVAKKIYKQLGFSDEEFESAQWADAVQWGKIKKGHKFAEKPEPVFVRLEGDLVTEPAASAAGAQDAGKKGKGGGQQQPKQPKQPKAPKPPKAPKAEATAQEAGAEPASTNA